MNHAQLIRRLIEAAADIWEVPLVEMYSRRRGIVSEALVAVSVLAYRADASTNHIRGALGMDRDWLYPGLVHKRHEETLTFPTYVRRFEELERRYRALHD